MRILLAAIVVVAFAINTQAQSDLIFSPVKHYGPLSAHYQRLQKIPTLKTGIIDTLNLPFSDDFSALGVYPNPNLWTDNKGYVNDHFSLNPPSYGLVTLDGLDDKGNAYNGLAPTISGANDTLTSQPINLAGLSSADNIYLSFFYQQQGLNNQRMTLNDSLVLYFKNLNGGWQPVWSTRDTLQRPFAPAIIKVENNLFFHGGFQFRFINFQNYLGNLKMWHLDYFLMNRNRGIADTVFPDMSVIDPPRSVFREFVSVPYTQFRANPAFFLDNDASILVGNMSNTSRNFKFRRRVTNDAGQTISDFTENTPQVIPPYTNFNYPFQVTATPVNETRDTVNYRVTNSIFDQGVDINRKNDSATRVQVLANYYAYDDGSAETGISIRNSPGALAVYFPLLRADTLRAVSFHFTQAEAINSIPFQMAVWSEVNIPGSGGTTRLLSSRQVAGPTFTDTINGFVTFEFDSGIFVSNEFYVGWFQNQIGLINVGWDYNFRISGQLTVNPYVFYFTQGSWKNAGVEGTPMIRPHLGRKLNDTMPVSVGSISKIQNIGFYPNPADESVEIYGLKDYHNHTISIFDIGGKMLVSEVLANNKCFSVETLKPGMYLMLLSDKDNQLLFRDKLIVK